MTGGRGPQREPQNGAENELGLEPDRVALAPWSLRWREAFAREREALCEALGELPVAIEHVGSTAVPELPAKPILDIAVAVRDAVDALHCEPRLSALGYDYRGDMGRFGGHFFVKARARRATHHLHVVRADDPQWSGYLLLRDHLVADTPARRAYAECKRELERRFPADREAYTAGKAQVILRLMAEALRGSPDASQ